MGRFQPTYLDVSLTVQRAYRVQDSFLDQCILIHFSLRTKCYEKKSFAKEYQGHCNLTSWAFFYFLSSSCDIWAQSAKSNCAKTHFALYIFLWELSVLKRRLLLNNIRDILQPWDVFFLPAFPTTIGPNIGPRGTSWGVLELWWTKYC